MCCEMLGMGCGVMVVVVDGGGGLKIASELLIFIDNFFYGPRVF